MSISERRGGHVSASSAHHSAIYAGSFDPVTLGHVDVIERGSRLFDKLYVGVGFNPAKKNYVFDIEQRLAFCREAVQHLENVEVVPFSGLLVRTAEQLGVTALLRGIRALSDFDLEFRNGLANRDLSGIETVFLLTTPSHIFVSSSLVKEIAQHGGDVSRYVPATVHQALRAHYGT